VPEWLTDKSRLPKLQRISMASTERYGYDGKFNNDLLLMRNGGHDIMCHDHYEGLRCQTCKGCQEGFACTGKLASQTADGHCYFPDDIGAGFGETPITIDLSPKKK
jgi:hypothetical protein